ncbi:hypothetical protein SFRURICE_013484, partial [Spodoptera frugiperda]
VSLMFDPQKTIELSNPWLIDTGSNNALFTFNYTPRVLQYIVHHGYRDFKQGPRRTTFLVLVTYKVKRPQARIVRIARNPYDVISTYRMYALMMRFVRCGSVDAVVRVSIQDKLKSVACGACDACDAYDAGLWIPETTFSIGIKAQKNSKLSYSQQHQYSQ